MVGVRAMGETSPRVDAHSYESRRGRHVALTGDPVCLPTSIGAQSGYGLSCGSFTWNERSTSSKPGPTLARSSSYVDSMTV